jgi:EAL domain-containing protein (putative c-di-GMP-specific phosphodiesterase class I)
MRLADVAETADDLPGCHGESAAMLLACQPRRRLHVLTDPRAEAIVRAVIDLSHALNLTPVAEGVERAEIATWLRDRGCEVAQGILYSPPITAQAVMELLSSPAAR